MKKRRAVIFSVLLTLSGPLAFADTQNPVDLTSQEHSLLKTNCIGVKTTLQRIHANDALSRVYLGQEYEIISTKLMAPMNSRAALNKLDSVALTETSVQFNRQLDSFRNVYRDYDQNVARTLQIDCQTDPDGFYNVLLDARAGRVEVRKSVDALEQLIIQYKSHVTELQAKSNQASTGGNS